MKEALFAAAVAGLFALVAPSLALADTVTVTGCLAKGDEEGEFELTNASGGDAKEYELIAAEGVELGPHVGHKVEIKGAPASEAEEKGSEKEEAAKHSHLKVSSMKHVAAECP